MRRSRVRRWCGMAVVYLLVAAAAALGWLWHSLPSEVCLEPGQALTLPRFAWVEPLHPSGTRNAASTRAAGSYRTTLSLGGWLPVKTIRALVTDRPTVTVCGTPFGVKMFSEGALVVGFSDIVTADGTVNPAKQAGLRLGGRDPAGGGGNRNERCRPRSAGSGRRPAAGAGLCPGQRTAADRSHPCVG